MRKLSGVARPRSKSPAKRRSASPSPEPLPAPPLTDPVQTILRAASFAARRHHGQTRADNRTPYFSHLARVALILSHVFGVHDEDVLAAALLHDTIEDTATSREEIAAEFNPRVADYVVALTKNVRIPKHARDEEYFARLARAPEPVLIAKMADVYDNLSARARTPKLTKTAATAGRLLQLFDSRLHTRLGRAAHAKLAAFLHDVLQGEVPNDVWPVESEARIGA